MPRFEHLLIDSQTEMAERGVGDGRGSGAAVADRAGQSPPSEAAAAASMNKPAAPGTPGEPGTPTPSRGRRLLKLETVRGSVTMPYRPPNVLGSIQVRCAPPPEPVA